MKKKEMIIANLILALLVVGFGYLAFSLSVNQNPFAVAQVDISLSQQEEQSVVGNCTDKPTLTIPVSNEQHLKKLADYQKACNSFVTDTMMFFTAFSENAAEANTNAELIAERLKQFKDADVKPLVVVEPYIRSEAMSYKKFLAGDYDAGTDQFFKKLKELGITDEMMGTWVPFPESNTPSWNNKDTEPRDFAFCVNRYLGKLKAYFPAAKGSILLNATTYEPSDLGWENGDYLSLAEYLHPIDTKLIDSFGIQGFPWVSNALQTKRTIFKAPEFLQPDLAIGAAQILRTRDIWLNTGTFASKYTQDPAKTVHLSLNERKALLNGIIEVANNIRDYQQNEYRVSINLFSEDKSSANEQTDWSYFQDENSIAVFKEFLAKAKELDIPVTLFDKAKWQLN